MINCKQNCETFIFTGAGKFKCKFVQPCKEGFTYFPRMNFNKVEDASTITLCFQWDSDHKAAHILKS